MRQALLKGFLLLILLCVPQGFKRITQGVTLSKLSVGNETHARWNVRSLSLEKMSEIERILSQPFTYLARGSQAFVFASQDGRYVLKLFRSLSKPHPWRIWLRTHVRGKSPKANSQEKINRILSAAKIAFDQAYDSTGVVYVHLNPTFGQLPKTTLRDRLGRTYHFDLNRAQFALQQRGRPLRETLLEAIEQNDPSRIRSVLDSFAQLIVARASKHIRNRDVNVYQNFGCLGSQVIEWDFGNYQYDRSLNAQEELRRFAPPLRAFLVQFAPEWLNEYDQKMGLR